ncbi:hypothetical protein KY330_00960 [Candidatus Woesearchaeota archaeon]|nr:hypothetical protein [Candidatus Woesearchaeota archaeon]
MEWYMQHAYYEFLMKNNVIGFFEERRKLKSGRMSNWYANFRKVTNSLSSKRELLGFLKDYIDNFVESVDYFIGVPESMTCAGESLNEMCGIERLVKLRANTKEHGAPQDRYFLGEIREGDKVVLLEDVTTTGGSLLKRVYECKEAGLDVVGTVGLLNRLEYVDKDTFERLGLLEKLKHGDNFELGVEDFFRRETDVTHYSMINAKYALPRAAQKLKPHNEIISDIEADFENYGVKPIKLR